MDEDLRLPNNQTTVRWIGRIFSVVLFLLMGAFFIEHLNLVASQQDQVAYGFVLNLFFHFGLLCGYLVSLRWEKFGSVLIVLFSLLFLIYLRMPRQFWFFFLTFISPVYFYGYIWFRETRLDMD